MESSKSMEHGVEKVLVQPRKAVGTKGKIAGKRIVAHDGVAKHTPGGYSGGNYVIVADKVEVSITNNFTF